jgi:hypothetical protein
VVSRGFPKLSDRTYSSQAFMAAMAGGSLVWSSLRAEDVSNIESQALWEEWPKSHVQQGSALILVTCSTCLAVSFRIESIVVFFRWFGLLRHTLKRKKADGGTAAPSTAFPLCSRSWFCMVLCLYLMKNQTHQPHQPRFAGYECDVCQEDILDGKRFFDCRKCDFSMCLKCQAQRSR